jgi:hypothetical protein
VAGLNDVPFIVLGLDGPSAPADLLQKPSLPAALRFDIEAVRLRRLRLVLASRRVGFQKRVSDSFDFGFILNGMGRRLAAA